MEIKNEFIFNKNDFNYINFINDKYTNSFFNK